MKVIDRLIHGMANGKSQQDLEKEQEIELYYKTLSLLRHGVKTLEYHFEGRLHKLSVEDDQLMIRRNDRMLPPIPCASTRERNTWTMIYDWRERLTVLRSLWREW